MVVGKLAKTAGGRWNTDKKIVVNPVWEDQRDRTGKANNSR